MELRQRVSSLIIFVWSLTICLLSRMSARLRCHGRMIEPPYWLSTIGLFAFQPVHHEWYIKFRGMCCPFYGKSAYKRSIADFSVGVAHGVVTAGFLSHYLCVVLNHMSDANITVNKMCWVRR